MKKILKLVLLFLALIQSFGFLSYALEEDTNKSDTKENIEKDIELESAKEIEEDKLKTIKELKDNIQSLDEEDKSIRLKDEFLKENSDFRSFFKEDLSIKDIDDIKEILELYKIYSSRLDQKLTTESKNLLETTETKDSLIEQRKDLFKKLVPYIDISKIDDYLEYVKSDAYLLKEKKEIKDDIIRKKWIIDEKITHLKEKIEEHKKTLDSRIIWIVNEKMDAKIDDIKNNPWFMSLEIEKKIEIIKKTIDKIRENLESIDKEEKSNEKKLEIYKIAIEKLEWFLNSLEE